MTDLYRDLLLAHRCRSTHHYIVIDALEHLDGPDSDDWRRLLMHEHSALLRGAKAPDAEFKDFKNHVLHISGDKEWGGARGAASKWYDTAVDCLRNKRWQAAAYAIGVLSHYYCDPFQPFHTDQSDAEGNIHRAVEWSIFKSRPELKKRIDTRARPTIPAGRDSNFVSDMVRAGAGLSHKHYQTFIDHYDIDKGASDPASGLDETLLHITSELLAHATSGVATLIMRAVAEAGAKPKRVDLSVKTYLAKLDIPIRKLVKKLDDAASRREVQAMYDELQASGKVIETLSDDDREIRALHARERLGISVAELNKQPASTTGTRHGKTDSAPAPVTPPAPVAEFEPALEVEPLAADTPEITLGETEDDAPAHIFTAPEPVPETVPEPTPEATPEPAPEPVMASTPKPRRLTRNADVEAAPSIGKRTAARLAKAGITTIGDLLTADAEQAAAAIDARHITPASIRDWQDQTHLQLDMPQLRAHDVQLLVGAGVRSKADLAKASTTELLQAAMAFAETPTAKRIISAANAPTEPEVEDWIEQARKAA